MDIRHDWTTERIEALYHLPLTELVFRAQTLHRRFHDPDTVQRCTLLSIKTGGCPEDCAYCPQSARYATGVEREELMTPDAVLAAARQARENGSTRFCMGAAWREVHDGAAFDAVLSMVGDVAALGMEVCTTLGMLTADQAGRLKSARTHRVQPQPGYLARVLSQHHHDAHVPGTAGHAAARAGRGSQRVLRRDRRDGGVGSRSVCDARAARPPRSAS